jgi:hypothetical protein
MDRIASKNLEEKNQVEQEELEGEEEEEWVMADYLQNSENIDSPRFARGLLTYPTPI